MECLHLLLRLQAAGDFRFCAGMERLCKMACEVVGQLLLLCQSGDSGADRDRFNRLVRELRLHRPPEPFPRSHPTSG